jgi:hypothetical protein
MRDELGPDDPTLEAALHGYSFAFGGPCAIFSTRTRIDECSATGVLQYKLIAEYLRDFALDGNWRAVSHLVDACGLQQHHLPRLPVLSQPGASGAQCGSCDQDDC